MIQLKFEIIINAPTDKVWLTLWSEESYREWTSVFSKGSYAKTDWKEGSKAYFLTPDGSGMLSKIKKSIPGRLMSIEHLGIVVDGVEDVQSNAAKSWAGAMEDYTLEVIEGHTLLRLKIDVVEAYKNFFLKTWPKALDGIKELAEKQS
ncbi:SRPBCC domain-containing protein [Flagellimonas oceanensis]|uniref:SRPBCC domain-containing protein n=1 Tax=Flagellimonas oceanensis TaxID=2499163 RepID=UPI000F8C95AD|nr:SRPBCC domain-containing protein [Allomuricauda oceanensis]